MSSFTRESPAELERMQLDYYWEAATQGFLPALAHAAQTANRLGDQVRIERYRKMQDEMQNFWRYTDRWLSVARLYGFDGVYYDVLHWRRPVLLWANTMIGDLQADMAQMARGGDQQKLAWEQISALRKGMEPSGFILHDARSGEITLRFPNQADILAVLQDLEEARQDLQETRKALEETRRARAKQKINLARLEAENAALVAKHKRRKAREVEMEALRQRLEHQTLNDEA
ncbi:hypothetical protein EV714DRAFT_239921 [Schizophyllum commune]